MNFGSDHQTGSELLADWRVEVSVLTYKFCGLHTFVVLAVPYVFASFFFVATRLTIVCVVRGGVVYPKSESVPESCGEIGGREAV